eukprot:11705-Heterococcus_DN1.PRE.3
MLDRLLGVTSTMLPAAAAAAACYCWSFTTAAVRMLPAAVRSSLRYFKTVEKFSEKDALGQNRVELLVGESFVLANSHNSKASST